MADQPKRHEPEIMPPVPQEEPQRNVPEIPPDKVKRKPPSGLKTSPRGNLPQSRRNISSMAWLK